MSKQTAVEWLIEQIIIHESLEKLSPYHTLELFEQALAMEKEQIVDAFNEGNQSDWNNEIADGGEQYYNETYGGQDV